ncbi:MAG: hypothetical protein LBT62_04275 [Deltaproteobacteria bacterium]|nr:hypothetical protein [Deltaproteobacteria bacterium]
MERRSKTPELFIAATSGFRLTRRWAILLSVMRLNFMLLSVMLLNIMLLRPSLKTLNPPTIQEALRLPQRWRGCNFRITYLVQNLQLIQQPTM